MIAIIMECVFNSYYRVEEDTSLEKMQLLQNNKTQLEHQRDKVKQEVRNNSGF